MKRVLELSLITLILVSLLVGCGSKSKIVAVVDGEEIPLSLINDYFAGIGTSFSSADAEFEAKRMALDSLIDYKLLVKGAYERGLDMDKELDKIVTSQRSRFLFDELYRQDILPKIEISDREVEQFLEKTRTEYRFSHILLASEERADSLYEELKNGADFGMAARALSLDQSSAVKGGDLGFFNWGRQVDPSWRETAFALKVGEISKPTRTPAGWHIIKNEESRPAEEPPGDVEMEFFARQIIRDRKSYDAELEFWNDLEHKADVKVNSEATQLLLEKLQAFYPDTIAGAPRPSNFFPNLELLQPFERQMVLATYTGGELTIEDYLNKIGNVEELYRPSFNDPDSMAKIIFQLELNNIAEFEADERKLDQSPEYLKRVRDFREGLMVEKFQQSVLTSDIDITEDEVVDYYNSHLEDFMTPAEYHILEIENDSVDLLKDLTRQANQGADFAELAATYTTRPGFKEKKGDLGMVPGYKYPALYNAARTLEPGGISPVVKNVRGHYAIVQLVDIKQPRVRPIEECEQEVRQTIRKLKRDNAVGKWLADRRAQSKIEVFEDVIRNSIDESKYATK